MRTFSSPQAQFPLKLGETRRLKESLFHNSLAEKYMKEEARLRVDTRRAEYASRVVEATKLKGEDAGFKGGILSGSRGRRQQWL